MGNVRVNLQQHQARVGVGGAMPGGRNERLAAQSNLEVATTRTRGKEAVGWTSR